MPSSKIGHVKPKIGAIAVLKDGVKTGWMYKTGFKNKGWKKRFCVLTRDTLYYFADANAGSQKGEVVLSEVTEVLLAEKTGKYLKKENVVTVQTQGGRPFFFAAPTAEEATLWIEKLNEFLGQPSGEKSAEKKDDEEKKDEVKAEDKKDEEEKKDEEKKEVEEKKDEEKKDEEKKEVEEEKEEAKKEEEKKEEHVETEEKNEQKEVDKKQTEEKEEKSVVEEKKEEHVEAEKVEAAAN